VCFARGPGGARRPTRTKIVGCRAGVLETHSERKACIGATRDAAGISSSTVAGAQRQWIAHPTRNAYELRMP